MSIGKADAPQIGRAIALLSLAGLAIVLASAILFAVIGTAAAKPGATPPGAAGLGDQRALAAARHRYRCSPRMNRTPMVRG